MLKKEKWVELILTIVYLTWNIQTIIISTCNEYKKIEIYSISHAKCL